MYDEDWPSGQGRVIRLGSRRAFVAMTAALLAVVALAAVAPGGWSGSSPGEPGGSKTRARVTFDVTPSAGFIHPFFRIDLHGCRDPRTVHLRTILKPVAAGSGRFAVRSRFHPAARAAKVRLRFSGRFTSPTRARGVLRGRLRYAGGHVCAIPRLAWTARPVGLPRDSGVGAGDDDEDLGDGIVDDDDEDIDDGEYDEDDTGDDGDDEDPGDDEDEGDDEP